MARHLSHHLPPLSFIRASEIEISLDFFSSKKIFLGVIPNVFYTLDAFTVNLSTLFVRESVVNELKTFCPPYIRVEKLIARAGWNLVKSFNHGLPRLSNVTPHFGAGKTLVEFDGNQSSQTPHLCPLVGLYPKKLYISMSWRLDSLSFIALTIYLVRRLVLAISGSTRPNPPYFFFIQHLFQLTLVRVICSLPDQR